MAISLVIKCIFGIHLVVEEYPNYLLGSCDKSYDSSEGHVTSNSALPWGNMVNQK